MKQVQMNITSHALGSVHGIGANVTWLVGTVGTVIVGDFVGVPVGALVGFLVGVPVGAFVGFLVGALVGL
jgi:hypothetical protein